MKLLLIRHGQTEVNASGSMHTLNDYAGLSEIGLRQAQNLIRVCKDHGVQMLYSSNENRAKQTAEIIAVGLGIKNNPTNALHERNWGEWEGRTWAEIKNELDTMNLQQRYTFVPPSGESWQQMETRLKQCVDKIIADGESTQVNAVAIVTHGGALRGLMPILKDTPKEVSLKYDFENASVTIFEYKSGLYTEITVNDTTHLME